MTTTAVLTVSYKKAENFIYQTVLISPTKKSHIRFFVMDKYEVGRQVSDFLDHIYIGDGENIFFREKKKFRNQFTIKYEVKAEKLLDLSEKKFHISGEVPKNDGCHYCEHWSPSKKGKSRCLLYKKFLDREKIFCVDFLEKN